MKETEVLLKADPGTINPDVKDFKLYFVKPNPRDRSSAIDALIYLWLNGI